VCGNKVNVKGASACRRGFTLIEVLIAAAVLSVLSAGLLTASWCLVQFAQDQADHMAADAYCHDLMWAVYSQEYEDIADIAQFRLNKDKELPRIETVDFLGRPKTIVPLMRTHDDAVPTCTVTVTENEGKTQKQISVELAWTARGTPKAHRLSVTREKTSREAR